MRPAMSGRQHHQRTCTWSRDQGLRFTVDKPHALVLGLGFKVRTSLMPCAWFKVEAIAAAILQMLLRVLQVLLHKVCFRASSPTSLVIYTCSSSPNPSHNLCFLIRLSLDRGLSLDLPTPLSSSFRDRYLPPTTLAPTCLCTLGR